MSLAPGCAGRRLSFLLDATVRHGWVARPSLNPALTKLSRKTETKTPLLYPQGLRGPARLHWPLVTRGLHTARLLAQNTQGSSSYQKAPSVLTEVSSGQQMEFMLPQAEVGHVPPPPPEEAAAPPQPPVNTVSPLPHPNTHGGAGSQV